MSADAVDKNQDIEVLRAVAIIFTICAHLMHLVRWDGAWRTIAPWIKYWGGVDLFFCISGFVIASSLLRRPRTATFRELGVPFWIRRMFRIWPAALTWLAIPLLAAWHFNSSGAFGQLRADAYGSVAAALQFANFYFMVCGSGVDSITPCGNADVYWSLSLEEQFYLVFPVLLYFMHQTSLRRLLVVIVLAQVFLPRPPESVLWYVRTDSICLGVLIAMSPRLSSPFFRMLAVRRGRLVLSTVALALIATLAVICITPALRIWPGLLALTSAGLVLIASCNGGVIIPAAGLRPAILWIGSRSFAIYLLHLPAFYATRELFRRVLPHARLDDSFALPMMVTSLALIVVLSELTFRVVETPLRNLGRRLARRSEAGMAAAGDAVVRADRLNHARNI
jgi:peptidoglycan/LPS O-acetylase OafA/YrhL